MPDCTIRKYWRYFKSFDYKILNRLVESEPFPSLGVAVLTGVCVHALSVFSISDTAVETDGILFCFSKQPRYCWLGCDRSPTFFNVSQTRRCVLTFFYFATFRAPVLLDCQRDINNVMWMDLHELSWLCFWSQAPSLKQLSVNVPPGKQLLWPKRNNLHEEKEDPSCPANLAVSGWTTRVKQRQKVSNLKHWNH